ncbi:hypothetical protein SDC9_40077 [bioreactor metagenome]|uniref:Autotransporter domain-containing protein n=1 Tax=bioreactor metagenome TaxID=1076179 RepID=A0A644VRB9_9ZZZZ|nr:autotransporter outer membrane beta-barrel domain-containing protein [Acidaminococcaceae bacterium]
MSGSDGVSGIGGSAYAMGVLLTDSKVALTTSNISAVATAGNGVASDSYFNDIQQYGNGYIAIAQGLVTENTKLAVNSAQDLTIAAVAQNASLSNQAFAIQVNNDSYNTYNVGGDFYISATAEGSTEYDNLNLNSTLLGKQPYQNLTQAVATLVSNSSFIVNANYLQIAANSSSSSGNNSTWAAGLAAYDSVVDVHAANGISITASAESENNNNRITRDTYAYGILGNSNTMSFVSDEGGILVGSNGDAVDVYGSKLLFDAKDDGITFVGDVNATDGSTLSLLSNTAVYGNIGYRNSISSGSLDISNSRLNLMGTLSNLFVSNATTLNNSTVYFYDDSNMKDKYNATSYRTFQTNDMDAQGTNGLFMRTNANGVYGGTAGTGDVISSFNTVTGGGTYNISVFDQGMRNGYMGVTSGSLNNSVTLIENAQESPEATYNVNKTAYDNGVWNYLYQGTVNLVDGNLVLTDVTTEQAVQSTAQKAAQDANKIAAGAAVSVFGADETLMDRLGELRNNNDGKDNNGVWAKYVGGKTKVNGVSSDSTYKYNGIEVGYDHKAGENWRVGIAGTYAKGDTTVYGGDGTVKTSAGALYGTWLGNKGHHIDIIAKVGKVDSDTSAYGGTVAQKMDGDFNSNAFSLAVQYGYRKALKNNWFIEPMVRASYVRLGSSDYTVTTKDGSMDVSNDSMSSVILRGGFIAGRKVGQASNVYLKAAVLHDFNGDIVTNVKADGRSAQYKDSIGGTGVEYGLGFNYSFNKKSNMYFDISRISGGEVTKDWGVNLGFRYNF